MNRMNPHINSAMVPTRSASICVRRHAGNGPDLVLLHGIGSSSADFDPVVSALSAFTQPITLDLRGHGASSRPAQGYRYDDYVHDLEDVLAALDLDRPIVLGHSLGGVITLFWATRHPGEARAIIIEDAPLRLAEASMQPFDGWLTLNALPQSSVRDWYASQNPTWSERVLDQRSFDMVNTERRAIEELRDLSLAGAGMDSVADLARITEPLLFLHGDTDTGSMTHPDDLNEVQRLMPHARIVRAEQAGHTIHRTHPETWLREVRAFVDDLSD